MMPLMPKICSIEIDTNCKQLRLTIDVVGATSDGIDQSGVGTAGVNLAGLFNIALMCISVVFCSIFGIMV